MANRRAGRIRNSILEVPRERLLTVSEVAHILHVHPNSVRRWTDLALLPSYRVGTRGDRRFKWDDIAAFLAASQAR